MVDIWRSLLIKHNNLVRTMGTIKILNSVFSFPLCSWTFANLFIKRPRQAVFIASQMHHKVCTSITVTCLSEWFFRVVGESNLPIFFYGTEGVLRSIKSVFSLIGWLKYSKTVMNSNMTLSYGGQISHYINVALI